MTVLRIDEVDGKLRTDPLVIRYGGGKRLPRPQSAPGTTLIPRSIAATARSADLSPP
jgi:hypothetical protein